MQFSLVRRVSSPICFPALAIVLIAVFGIASKSRAAERPNIVVIMADDMGYECVSANGSESYSTPNIDRLAAGGMRFEHAYSQPICTPTRVQIMTGIYNQRNYVRFGLLEPSQKTFAHFLRKAGYKTAIAGKWQLLGGMKGPDHFGFDEFCLWQLTRRPGRYPNPGLEINGKEVDFTKGEYGPDIASDFLCDYMERQAKGEDPFLVWYPMILPHWPFEPTPASSDYDPKAKGVLKGTGNSKYFKDMVEYTDRIVGKIDAKLDELGIRENTLLIFTGDNGTATQVTSRWNGRSVKGGKGNTTDFGHHVPMVASWPGTIKPGQVTKELVDFSDVLPTLVETAGSKLPEDHKVDGRSFLGLLTGDAEYKPRKSIYCWYARNGGPTGKEFSRNQRFKLYRTGEIYDISQDDLEKNNLAGKPDAIPAGTLAMLQSVLEEMKDTRVMLPDSKKKKTAKKNNTNPR
ncbi:MAG: sulfatase-like hydrolase/transferase [Planctomycetes bacterium]|nr:sulfatase-like hydrolase/transferase [Planctomycetota bacterium]